ncbi:hypothetical protein ACI3PL_32875, partial [Lacticaseibacillus paracasei]
AVIAGEFIVIDVGTIIVPSSSQVTIYSEADDELNVILALPVLIVTELPVIVPLNKTLASYIDSMLPNVSLNVLVVA